MTDFRVGDKVVIMDGAKYVITTPGSKGIIKQCLDGDSVIDVKFFLIASMWKGHVGDVFAIDKKWIQPIDPNYVPPTKQELLCEKVKQMYAKRKAKGYAF